MSEEIKMRGFWVFSRCGKRCIGLSLRTVQLDGRGKAVENIVGYTGVTHCDFDHILFGFTLEEVITMLK